MKYVFATIFALFAMSSFAVADEPIPIRICAGKIDGNYTAFSKTLAQNMSGDFAAEVIITKGSTDNLKRLAAGECDIAPAQSDAYFVFTNDGTNAKGLDVERVGAMYSEYVHVVCNANIDADDPLGDLIAKKRKLVINDKESGHAVTANGLILADKLQGGDAYTNLMLDSSRTSVAKAILAVKDGQEAGCLLYVGGKGTDYMNTVANESDGGESLVIANLKDKDFDDVTDKDGQSVYSVAEIDKYWYKGFNYGIMSSNMDTVKVQAVMFANKAWSLKYPAASDAVATAFLSTARNFRAEHGLDE